MAKDDKFRTIGEKFGDKANDAIQALMSRVYPDFDEMDEEQLAPMIDQAVVEFFKGFFSFFVVPGDVSLSQRFGTIEIITGSGAPETEL